MLCVEVRLRFVELFAGIGLFRLGLEALGPEWRCVMANDNSEMKARAYALNFGTDHLLLRDIAQIGPEEIPDAAPLITASFPCQDLSLAGNRAGLVGERSGTFYGFIRLLRELAAEHRAPGTVVLENVPGLLTSHRGEDVRGVLHSLNTLGYGVDLLLLDAAQWLPQSRPRVFIVGRLGLETTGPLTPHPARPASVGRIWQNNGDLTWAPLRLPPLPGAAEASTLAQMVEDEGTAWFGGAELERELGYIRSASRQRLHAAQQATLRDGQPRYLAGYRRMRQGLVCLELRDDGRAGCLRTPTGGSSRQLLVRVTPEGPGVRWMTPREYARLMGVPDDFRLPDNTREALYGFGDAVAVPVVSWLGQVLQMQQSPAAPAPAPVPQPWLLA